jgi:signal transduction histidine kinase
MEKRSREVERMTYIGQLITSLSHEIRNPLSSVKMNLQILSKNMILIGNDRKRLQISEREINRLEGILQELLNFAKPVSLKLSQTDINQIVRSCVELLEMKFHRKSIDCQIHTDQSLKDFPADKGKIEQMIINFLLNALDSVDDFGTIRILTGRAEQKGLPYAMIRIEDDGKGIPEELLPHIFEPFYTTKTTGTGLGLANVKQIVTAHHGRIEVMALKNSGTAFEVFLPMGETNG